MPTLHHYNRYKFGAKEKASKDDIKKAEDLGLTEVKEGKYEVDGEDLTAPTSESDMDDVELMARVICGEARPGDEDGMLAVGTTIMNRLNAPAFRRTEFGGSRDRPLTMNEVCNGNAYEARQIKNSGYRNPTPECYAAARKCLAGYRHFEPNIYFFRTSTAYKPGSYRGFKKLGATEIGGNTFFTYEGYENG